MKLALPNALLGTLLGVFYAPAGLAYPTLNDYASYSGKIKTPAGTLDAIKQEVQITEFDAKRDSFKQVVVLTMNGQTQKDEVWTNKKDLVSAKDVQDILTNCAQNQGTIETVQVAAGTFNSCALAHQEGDVMTKTWVADVPFGVVKGFYQSVDGSNRTEYELDKFKP